MDLPGGVDLVFVARSPWGVEKLGALAINPGGWICAFCQLTPGGAFSWKILAAALGGGLAFFAAAPGGVDFLRALAANPGGWI